MVSNYTRFIVALVNAINSAPLYLNYDDLVAVICSLYPRLKKYYVKKLVKIGQLYLRLSTLSIKTKTVLFLDRN